MKQMDPLIKSLVVNEHQFIPTERRSETERITQNCRNAADRLKVKITINTIPNGFKIWRIE